MTHLLYVRNNFVNFFFSHHDLFVCWWLLADSDIPVEKAEREKHRAIEQANNRKAELVAEKERSNTLPKPLTDSECAGKIDRIREHLLRISYLVSNKGGCSVYDDRGRYRFDSDLT